MTDEPGPPPVPRKQGKIAFWICLFAPPALAALIFSIAPSIDKTPAPFFFWAVVALGCSFTCAFLLGAKMKKSVSIRILLTIGLFIGLSLLNLILFVIGCCTVDPPDFR